MTEEKRKPYITAWIVPVDNPNADAQEHEIPWADTIGISGTRFGDLRDALAGFVPDGFEAVKYDLHLPERILGCSVKVVMTVGRGL